MKKRINRILSIVSLIERWANVQWVSLKDCRSELHDEMDKR